MSVGSRTERGSQEQTEGAGKDEEKMEAVGGGGEMKGGSRKRMKEGVGCSKEGREAHEKRVKQGWGWR